MITREEYCLKFGQNLKRVREGKGLSLRELALEIESEKPTLSRIENGKVNPSIYFVKRLAVGLSISESDLLNF